MMLPSASSTAPTIPPTEYAAVKSEPVRAWSTAIKGRYTAMYISTASISRFKYLIPSPSC